MSVSLLFSAEAVSLRQSLRQRILTIGGPSANGDSFESLALAIFRYQATYNPVYQSFLRHLNVRPDAITDLRRVPFMPIGFFKKHPILTGSVPSNDRLADTLTFVSSGTTGDQTSGMPPSGVPPSRHYVPDPDLYDAVSTRIFEQTYGPLRNVHILALLPSYLERNNSSLVYMVQRFIGQTNSSLSDFFLTDHDALTDRLRLLTEQPDNRRILLIGVTFGLLDWAESARDLSFLGQNPNLIVMETGGMKGRRQELLREEVHALLTRHLSVQTIHSEYGMTELLSQAYSTGNGIFSPGPTLRILLRDINDPFFLFRNDYVRTGGINVIDLANLDSCSFIETQDLGQYVGTDGQFRVIGRFDNSDVRGCNLMVVD